MKNAMILSFVIVLLAGVLPGYGQGGRVFLKVRQENLRKSPGGPQIGELAGGTQLEVLERRADWVRVRVTGWIWAESLVSDSTRVDGYQIRVSHILLADEQEAVRVRERLDKGESFDALAQAYSIDKASAAKGGDMGRLGRGDLSPAHAAFEAAAFRLKPGAISGIVKTNLGFHIIMRTQ
ncbi:MAG TPA: hypothetical protein ENN17_10215 [bacterium]|nr:hypothetical protein [bacterium]